jgi:hypothetical protein
MVRSRPDQCEADRQVQCEVDLCEVDRQVLECSARWTGKYWRRLSTGINGNWISGDSGDRERGRTDSGDRHAFPPRAAGRHLN